MPDQKLPTRRRLITTVTDLEDATVDANRLDDGDLRVSIRNARGTEVSLRGSRMGLLELLDDARTAVVLLDDADGEAR